LDKLVSQSIYARQLRAQLPDAAFAPDHSKLLLLAINLLILMVGWGIGAQLHTWPKAFLPLYLPFAFGMSNSIVVLAFVSHDLMHGSIIRDRKLSYKISLVSNAMLWMPPTLWAVIHNRIHHNNTNTLVDPDRSYLHQEPNTIGKWVQNLIFPSSDVILPCSLLGLMVHWPLHVGRHILSIIVLNGKSTQFVPATHTLKPRERWQSVRELVFIAGLNLGVLAWLSFNPLQILLAYILPLALGYGMMMAYIDTNHILSPMTKVNDPLVNSVSLRLPKVLDVLHLHFSHHAEHHIFPGLNSDYYPLVRQLIQKNYPLKTDYLLTGTEAWSFLVSTPRHYLDATTFTDWQGHRHIPCHGLPRSVAVLRP
jgi:fatty acid desaturase